MLEPGLESDLIVHFCQEWIETIVLPDDSLKDKFIVNLSFSSLNSLDLQENSIFCGEFNNLILGVHLEVTIFSTHASVKQFIEINITIITSNSHPKHNSLLIRFFHLIRET
jgi:hypothetical protein